MINDFGRARLCLVRLADGRKECPPAHIILNEAEEGKRSHVWCVWTHYVDDNCDLTSAADGMALGPLMLYFADSDEYKDSRETFDAVFRAIDAVSPFILEHKQAADRITEDGIAVTITDYSTRAALRDDLTGSTIHIPYVHIVR